MGTACGLSAEKHTIFSHFDFAFGIFLQPWLKF